MTVIYYAAFPHDGWPAYGLVYGIWFLDTVQTVLITIDQFNTFARHFGDRALLDGAQLEWLAVPILSSISTCRCAALTRAWCLF